MPSFRVFRNRVEGRLELGNLHRIRGSRFHFLHFFVGDLNDMGLINFVPLHYFRTVHHPFAGGTVQLLLDPSVTDGMHLMERDVLRARRRSL